MHKKAASKTHTGKTLVPFSALGPDTECLHNSMQNGGQLGIAYNNIIFEYLNKKNVKGKK